MHIWVGSPLVVLLAGLAKSLRVFNSKLLNELSPCPPFVDDIPLLCVLSQFLHDAADHLPAHMGAP